MKPEYDFIVQANNIHTGGGYVLLNSLLSNLPESSHVFLDSRNHNVNNKFSCQYVKPNLLDRFKSELSIKKLSSVKSKNLFFTNLPPLFKLRGKTVLFIQNAILLSFSLDAGYSLKVKLRHLLERIWLRMFIRNVDKVVVQSESMKELTDSLFNGKVLVEVIPFHFEVEDFKRTNNNKCTNRQVNNTSAFVYIASGDVHKNHVKLIDAWVILAKNNILPELTLTLDRKINQDLLTYLDFCIKKYKLNIINTGWVNHTDVKSLYDKSDCLIFPSLTESFGVPLIEARNYQLDIIASELDYIRDLVDPEQSFNPNSATSIARAVFRYLNLEFPYNQIISPQKFLEKAF